MSFHTTPAPDLLSFDSYSKRETAPNGSKNWAYTRSEIKPSGLAPLDKPTGGVSVAASFKVTVSLNLAQSWVLKAHTGDAKLLEHERLHYLIAVCVGLKLHTQVVAAVKPNLAALQAELTRLNGESGRLHTAITQKYDSDTGHGTNADLQATWATRIRGWYATKTLTF